MSKPKAKDIQRMFLTGTEIDEALAAAAREARRRHKLLGHPIVVWQDGQVVRIPPEQIVVDPPEAKAPRAPAGRRQRARGRHPR